METIRTPAAQPLAIILSLKGRLALCSHSLSRLIDLRSCLAFGLPFIIYLLTLAPTIYALDSAELSTAAASGGIARSTGYPLYLFLGNLFSRLPFGDVGYRMNLLSAICGALTIALTERFLRRLNLSNASILGALGLLAFSTHFWGLSLIAEVYTLHTALMAALILALLRWSEQMTSKRLMMVSLLLGLSLAHHGATLLLLPGMAWFIGQHFLRRRLPFVQLAQAASGLLLGAAFYLYLPARHAQMPAFNYAGSYDAAGVFHPFALNSLEGLWRYVSSQSFSHLMFAYRGPELLQETQHYLLLLWRSFLAIGIGPGLLGMVVMLRRKSPLGMTLLLIFAANAIFFINYRVIDKETMFLPTYLVWSLWLGVGYHQLQGWLQGMHAEQPIKRSLWIFNGIIGAAVLISLLWNRTLVDQSHNRSPRQYGEAILREALPGALILGYWETAPILEYLQIVEGRRPDVTIINRFLISPQDQLQLIEEQAPCRPVYIDSPPSDLGASYRSCAVGQIYRLTPRKSTAAHPEGIAAVHSACPGGMKIQYEPRQVHFRLYNRR